MPRISSVTIASTPFAKDMGASAPWSKVPGFPEYHEEVRKPIAEGDRVVAHLTISGTQQGQWGPLPATGKRAKFDELVILRIRDGKIVRQRGVVDNLSTLRQLGAVPSPRSLIDAYTLCPPNNRLEGPASSPAPPAVFGPMKKRAWWTIVISPVIGALI